MIEFSGRGILLDIEGTTSSISFVYDVMFPYARRELQSYLAANWNSTEVRGALEMLAADAGYASFSAWSAGTTDIETCQQLVSAEVLRLMDDDAKATGLKELQGLIWRSGFESGELRAHVYDDVPPNIRRWQTAGIDVRIYSSGSVGAQKLLFGHTVVGDLLPLLGGYYDTTTGSKRDPESYVKIADSWQLAGEDILFLSDVPAELDAARQAGLLTGLCIRPGNAEVPPGHEHHEITSFSDVTIRYQCQGT